MLKFVQENFKPSLADTQNLYRFEKIYQKIQDAGGFLKLYSQRNIHKLLQQEEAIYLFQQYLLACELGVPLNGENLKRAKWLKEPEVMTLFLESSDKWLKEQVIIWTMTDHMVSMINDGQFGLKELEANHGKQLIDVRIQVPTHDSFFIDKSNQQLQGLTISNYIEYIGDPKKFLRKHSIAQNMVLFGVNVDMDGWDKEMKHLFQFMPKSLQPQEQQDGLSYLRQPILGVNIPQIYIKVEGVWTGGHQENMSVNAINFNHGPGECLWITVDAQHVPQLRQKVLEKQEIDILKSEGLWFKEVTWFLENGIPVKSTIQKKGEVVILGAGCLHWVKSLGTTVNSAWNYLSLQFDTFEEMRKRSIINNEINYRTVIPYKNLLMDIYIHERDLPRSIIDQIRNQLQDFVDLEHNIVRHHEFTVQYVQESKQVQLCSKCTKEIFLFFYNDKGGNYYYCVNCIPKNIRVISSKYQHHYIYYLLQTQPSSCSPLYCAPYMGKTKCSVQDKFKESDQSVNKLNSMSHGSELLKIININFNEDVGETEPRKRIHKLIREDDSEEPIVNKKTKN